MTDRLSVATEISARRYFSSIVLNHNIGSIAFYFLIILECKISEIIIIITIMLLLLFLRDFHASVSWWSFTGVHSDSKSPQISRALLYILADLNKPTVWMVSTCPLIFKSSTRSIKTLEIVPSAPITIGITVTFLCYSLFLVLWQGIGINLFFRFLLFLVCGPTGQQSPQFGRFSCFVDNYKVWSSGRD